MTSLKSFIRFALLCAFVITSVCSGLAGIAKTTPVTIGNDLSGEATEAISSRNVDRAIWGRGSEDEPAPTPVGSAEPCGFVEFTSRNAVFQKDGSISRTVRMIVYLGPDRTRSNVDLDYPFTYPNAAADPWSAQNLRDPYFPMFFQPPPTEKRAGEPPIVQFVMTHSNLKGLTTLRNC